jgi:hypothetical protein
MFKYKGSYIVNLHSKKVISVKDRKDIEAQPIHVENRRGDASQRWRIVYTNEMKGNDAYRKKGQ